MKLIAQYWWMLPVALFALMVLTDLISEFWNDDKAWTERYELIAQKPHWLLRLPGIRRIRYLWNVLQLNIWTGAWGRSANKSDLATLYAISRGWC
jgi:hypothetical protein